MQVANARKFTHFIMPAMQTSVALIHSLGQQDNVSKFFFIELGVPDRSNLSCNSSFLFIL